MAEWQYVLILRAIIKALEELNYVNWYFSFDFKQIICDRDRFKSSCFDLKTDSQVYKFSTLLTELKS